MKNHFLGLFAVLALVLSFAGLACRRGSGSSPAPNAQTGTDVEKTIQVGLLERSYIVHIPPGYDGENSVPLVLVFHGGGSNAERMEQTTHFSEKSDEAGFLLVYPRGTGPVPDVLTWNAGNCCGWALDHQVDEIAFVNALLDQLSSDYQIDPARIYATGISNGAMLCYKLACEISSRFVAIAPVAGAMNVETCSASNSVSVIIFHGTEDRHVLYEGGAPEIQDDGHERIDKPVSYAVSFWVGQDQCDPVPLHESSGSILIDRYAGGISGSAVALYTIVGGGHAWPGGEPAWEGGDPPTGEISATDLIWEFFGERR